MFNAPDSAAGKKAKCPKCGGAIQIPIAAPAEEIMEAEEVTNRPFDDGDFEVEPPISTPVPMADLKPCPMCGEMIQKNAVKCRHCGEIFDPVLRAAAKSNASARDTDANLSVLEWVVAILCSGIGCIIGIVWMIQGKPKGKKMLLVSFCVQLFWGAVQAILAVLQHH